MADDPSQHDVSPEEGGARAAAVRRRRWREWTQTPRPAFGDGVTPRPLLRGWLHLVCFFLAIPAGALLVVGAASTRGRVGSAVYALGLAAVFGVSAAYHRGRWSPAGRRRMKRLDHGTIFVMIAGSFTPLALVVVDGAAGAAMLVAAWTGAAVGLAMAFVGIAETPVGSVSYIAFGWLFVFALPELAAHLSTTQITLLAVGGLMYTVGAIAFLSHWPDPFPHVFGYHEIWHLMVVAAVVCHYLTISSVVRSEGA